MASALAASSLNGVKIYNLASGKTLPQWMQEKTKQALSRDEGYRRRVELLQDFDFAAGSQCLRMSPDQHYVMATGMYPPCVKVFDVRELSLKFERRLDAEVVQFEVLSPDCSKMVFLQTDRTLAFHAPYGTHETLRIPKFGRGLCYHRGSCDLYVAASSSQVYRVNLDQGRFVAPLEIHARAANVVAVNPIHQLVSVGCDDGTVECWDSRSHARAGILDCYNSGNAALRSDGGVQITSLAADTDGLTFAVGTSHGHCLLYDLRSSKPLVDKVHQYGLPVVNVQFHNTSGNVLSSDAKVIKIWNRNSGDVFTNVETPAEVRDVCVVDTAQGDKSGVLLVAGEQERVMSYYIPALGIAPPWCSFLDALTEELEEEAQATVYEDYKFVTRQEITQFGLEHLIGTPLLKAYMHGFFMDARLHAKVQSIVEPFEYDRWRKERLQAKMEAKHANRITIERRLPKVNRAAAERLLREQAKAKKADTADHEDESTRGSNPLGDTRFAQMFMSKDYEIDEESDTYRLLHPNAALQKQKERKDDIDSDGGDEDDDEDENEGRFDRVSEASDENESEPEGQGSDDDDDDDELLGRKPVQVESASSSKSQNALRKPKFYELAVGEKVDSLLALGSQRDQAEQAEKKALAKIPLAARVRMTKAKESERSAFKREHQERGGYVREMSFVPEAEREKAEARGDDRSQRRKKRGVGELRLSNPRRNSRFRR